MVNITTFIGALDGSAASQELSVVVVFLPCSSLWLFFVLFGFDRDSSLQDPYLEKFTLPEFSGNVMSL